MKLIPTTPKNNHSQAEIKVFDRLLAAFPNEQQFTAYHSLGLSEHEYKKVGEADFVIICPFGIYVLEVKGGSVSCQQGRWNTTSRYQLSAIQDPFEQAKSAMYAIRQSLEARGIHLKNNLYGFGIIFPDVTWNVSSTEWSDNYLCDTYKMRNFEAWLQGMFSHWRSKGDDSHLLSTSEIEQIKQLLRPNFDLVPRLYSEQHVTDDETIALTKEQYHCLDILEANPRALCSGSAGTGKTLLAVELASRLVDRGKKVLFLCKSPWLRSYLSTQIKEYSLTLSTLESLKVDMKRKVITQYDSLIIDEGQDLFKKEAIELIDPILINGLTHGEWYIFHDINNQSSLFGEPDQKTLHQLRSYRPAEIPLTTNCRNTRNISRKIQSELGINIGTQCIASGSEVRIFNTTRQESPKVLSDLLNTLFNEGISVAAITILSPLAYQQSLAADPVVSLNHNIVPLDEYAVRYFPHQNITFSEIKNFKGIENDVIILIDMPSPKNSPEFSRKSEYYVGMTRARSLLCAIWL